MVSHNIRCPTRSVLETERTWWYLRKPKCQFRFDPQHQARQSVAVGEKTITVPVRAAEGRYRVAAVFGYDGSTLAYSREDFQLDGASANITLPMPTEALAANRVLIRLLNKDNLGLEDECELALTPRQAPPDFSKMLNMKRLCFIYKFLFPAQMRTKVPPPAVLFFMTFN